MGIGGIGDWGLGIGDWGLGPIPNPQSPIPNPQSPIPIHPSNNILKFIFRINMKMKLCLIFLIIISKSFCEDPHSLLMKEANKYAKNTPEDAKNLMHSVIVNGNYKRVKFDLKNFDKVMEKLGITGIYKQKI